MLATCEASYLRALQHPSRATNGRYCNCEVVGLYCCRVRKQVVNIPSFIVRLDSQKHIDFSLKSPYGGGRPGLLLCFVIDEIKTDKILIGIRLQEPLF